MKLVRKLLRLFPFLILLGVFIITLTNNHQVYALTDYQSNVAVPSYQIGSISSINNDIWNTLTDYFITPMYDNEIVYDIADKIAYLWSNNNLGIEDLPVVSKFIIIVLLYELFLSFLFLIFDVFNFMIGIASNWLRKGENLNE